MGQSVGVIIQNKNVVIVFEIVLKYMKSDEKKLERKVKENRL